MICFVNTNYASLNLKEKFVELLMATSAFNHLAEGDAVEYGWKGGVIGPLSVKVETPYVRTVNNLLGVS